jgi:hypothetical protein
MIEAAVCLFLLLFSGATYALFRFLKRIYRHRPPAPQEDSWLAALFAPLPAPENSPPESGRGDAPGGRPGEAP